MQPLLRDLLQTLDVLYVNSAALQLHHSGLLAFSSRGAVSDISPKTVPAPTTVSVNSRLSGPTR